MNIEPNYTVERLRFREHYRNLTDDDLARLAIDENLIPAARDAITQELDSRGLQDLSSLKNRFAEKAAVTKAEGAIAGLPLSALPTAQKDHQLLGLTGLVMFGLIGVHKWLVGDATTWRKEGTLAVWLFWALMLTWAPTVRFVKGQASGKLVFWLILGWLYVATTAAPLAVPALGRVVSGFNPVLVIAIIASPAIVLGVHRAVRRFASRSR